jgi:hypothetical protein
VVKSGKVSSIVGHSFRDLHNIPEPREQHSDQLPAIAQRHYQAVVGPLP